MRLFRYWSRAEAEVRRPDGSRWPVCCWRGSDVSADEADAQAQAAARDAAARLTRGQDADRRYPYGDRPLREEVLRQIRDADGVLTAAVTRNAYGAEVLNAASALFIDVDLPPPRTGSWLKRLFTRPPPPAGPDPAAEAAALAKLTAWVSGHAGWSLRVYRTAAGLRALATHAPADPSSDAVQATLTALDCDPRYIRLCRVQGCFRARLTPKPWRCGVGKPPGAWPWADAAAESAFRRWEQRYRAACAGRATCARIATLGSELVHPDLVPLVELHDQATGAASALPLA